MRAALLQRSAFSERCWWVVEHATSLCPAHHALHSALPFDNSPSVRQLALPFNSSPFCLMLDSVLVECQREFQSQGKGLTMFARCELHSGEFFYRSTLLYLTGLYANDATSNWLMWYANSQCGRATSTPTVKQWCPWCQDPNEWRRRPSTTTDSEHPPPVPQPTNNNGPWVPTDGDEPRMPTTHRGRPVPTIPTTTRTTVDDPYVPLILGHGKYPIPPSSQPTLLRPRTTPQDDNDATTRPWDDDKTMTWDEYDPTTMTLHNDVSTTMQKKDMTSTWDDERTMTTPPLYTDLRERSTITTFHQWRRPPTTTATRSTITTFHQWRRPPTTIATTATRPHHPQMAMSANTGCWGTLLPQYKGALDVRRAGGQECEIPLTPQRATSTHWRFAWPWRLPFPDQLSFRICLTLCPNNPSSLPHPQSSPLPYAL